MNLILLFTCVLMWALAVLTTISLLKLLKEMDRLDNELEKQQEELISVEGAIYEITKEYHNGWRAVLCDDERRNDVGENSDI